MEIRIASPEEDAEALRAIYEPYVLHTAVSFEYDPPGTEEFRDRMRSTLRRYPYLIAAENGEIVGYAYAGPFHPRAAYQHSAELSVYVKQGFGRRGIGRSLYETLEAMLLRQNIYTVHACIAVPDGEDPFLTDDSERFHRRMGFVLSAKHEHVGYKFGKWYSVIWMDKEIKEKPSQPEGFLPFETVRTR